MSKISFLQTMQGYLLAAGMRHLSEHAIRGLRQHLDKVFKFPRQKSISRKVLP